MVTAVQILAVHYSDNERLFPQSSGDAAGGDTATRGGGSGKAGRRPQARVFTAETRSS
jgi:hypothetical protein